MKATGSKIERETIINFNDAEDTTYIWTASNRMYKTLIKRGYVPLDDRERSATFSIPKKRVSIKRPSTTSEKRLEGLAKARSTVRTTTSGKSLFIQ